MTSPTDSPSGGGRSTFRTTLFRVGVVQIVALALLWWLQSRYHG